MSDSDSDAPEAIALSHSARAAQGYEEALQKIVSMERRKTKERNRARDERLKSQAAGKRDKFRLATKRGKIEGGGDASDRDAQTRQVRARMNRVMVEAGDEGNSAGEDEPVPSDVKALDVADELGGKDPLGEDGVYDMGEDSPAMGEDGQYEQYEEIPASITSRNYLPDHVFAAAAAALPSGSKRSTQEPFKSNSAPRRKRKHSDKRAKDIVVGSHAVRTLPSALRTSADTSLSYTPAPGATTAPARIHRFLCKSLSLKGGKKAAGQGWERKPVNIGLFKRNEGAPVAGFVRRQ